MKDSKKLAQPFFKWVGGKRQIADIILDEFPTEIENYYEPFVGAGAMLFRVLQEYFKSELGIDTGDVIIESAIKYVRQAVMEDFLEEFMVEWEGER